MRNYVVKTNPLNDGFTTPLSALFEPGALARLWGSQPSETYPTMPVEILDSEHEIVLRAELPGLQKENIQVSYHEHTLTIAAEKRLGKLDKEQAEGESAEGNTPAAWTVVRNERFQGRLERRFRLPFPVDFEAGQGQFTDGVLTLRLPKVQPKSARTLTIN